MNTQWQVAMHDDTLVFKQLDELKELHRKLDADITGAIDDEMTRARKKKLKLQLRDQILTLEMELFPDVPA
jgi:hypothetical protein